MKFPRHPRSRGIALIIVMVVILAMTVLVGGFVYSMKVEVKLARNNSVVSETEWLGRSGVEFAKYVLAMQMNAAAEPFDSLNQKWAGGPGASITNVLAEDFSLDDNHVGAGTFSLRIIDLERKFNINYVDQPILQQALKQMGADASISPTVFDSIADWIDRDEDRHLAGAESEFYLAQRPAYFCKNGPLDDISELLLIQGVTPNLYWGPRVPSHFNQGLHSRSPGHRGKEEPVYPVGLVDLFTALSAKYININTASAQVFQLIPGIDENIALSIIRTRAGPDGADGTEDDIPFRNPGELVNVPGISREAVAAYQQRGLLFVRSATFEVTVVAEIGGVKREYLALLRRTNPRDIQVLTFYAK